MLVNLNRHKQAHDILEKDLSNQQINIIIMIELIEKCLKTIVYVTLAKTIRIKKRKQDRNLNSMQQNGAENTAGNDH